MKGKKEEIKKVKKKGLLVLVLVLVFMFSVERERERSFGGVKGNKREKRKTKIRVLNWTRKERNKRVNVE